MSITIYGASDDLIEVDGDVSEEFPSREAGNFIAVSDGTVLVIRYDAEGIWRITPKVHGTAAWELKQATGPDDPEYSDRVTLVGDIAWVVVGDAFEAACTARKSRATDPEGI